MGMKDAYEKKLQAQLEEWEAELLKLKSRADKAQANAQLEYYKQINELRSLRDAAHDKLVELQEANEEAWEDLKKGVETSWKAFESALESAASRFKK
jgi:uncharacterized coiled-coil DUF342 family protein